MLDLSYPAGVLAGLVAGVRDGQLAAPTPCEQASVGDLLDHVDGLSLAFAAAAAKSLPPGGGPGPSAEAARLGPDWRTRIPRRLTSLAQAWQREDAWEGATQAGGMEMPAGICGLVALDEVIVHGWDIAVATGQPFEWEPGLVAAAQRFVEGAVEQNPQGTPGLFGPPVAVADGAPALDRLLGLTGRDPGWRPAGG